MTEMYKVMSGTEKVNTKLLSFLIQDLELIEHNYEEEDWNQDYLEENKVLKL